MNKIFLVLFLTFSLLTNAQNNCEKYKDKDENTAITELHFGTGMSIRNSWKLWAGTSDISKYFRDLGINHPDDMSSIILTSLHRKINEKPIELENQIKYYQDYWTESEKKQKERQKEEFSEFKIGNKMEFTYDYDFVSKKQEGKYMDDKCFAKGIIIGLNTEKLEVQVKLKKSCDPKGIIISKYDVWEEIDGEYQKIEEDKIKIMKKGETLWTSYELWDIVGKATQK